MTKKGNLDSSAAAEVITKETVAETKAEPKKAAPTVTKKIAKSEQKIADEGAAVKETAKKEETPVASVAVVEATQAAPAKKTTKKTAEKKTESKTTVKKAAAPKKTVKKTTTRKITVSKAEPVMELYVQYHGKQIDEKALLERVMQDCSEQKIKVEDIKLYVKPEDNACYYVANGNVAGKVGLY